MTIHDRRSGADPPDGQVRNVVDSATVSGGLVQAHTITGGIHHHHHPAARPVPRQLPPPPHGFVGRLDHLATLDRALPTTGAVVISAAGGIGKTWLALTWAHRNAHRFPDGQLFADLHGFSPTARPADPVDVLGGFLDALGVGPTEQPDEPDRRAALYRSLVADKQVLVVLDNAAAGEQVTPLLPGGDRCAVLVTSRDRLHGLVTRHGARPVRPDVLTDTEAHDLLTTALDTDRAGPADELVRLCGGFPLALGLVAARAATEPHLPLADIAADLRTLGLAALDSADPGAGLPTVLSWSLRRLTEPQRRAFALLGVAPGPDIGLLAAACLTGLSERDTHAVVRALADASLVERLPGGRYGMHDLVRAYAATLADDRTREAALRRVVAFHTHTAHAATAVIFPEQPPLDLTPPAPSEHTPALPDPAAALAWLAAEYPCLLAAQRTAAARHWHETVWWLAHGLLAHHARHGHPRDRITVWQAALDAAAHLTDPITRYIAHRNLSDAHAKLGQHDTASEHLTQAHALTENHPDPLFRAHTHQMLAWSCERQGDLRRAYDHIKQALELFLELGAPWDADALYETGWFAARVGEYDTARDHSNAALARYGTRHPEGRAAVLDNLGYTAHHSGHHREAVEHYRQALDLWRDLGNLHEAADVLDHLGHPHLALGQHERARTAWHEARDLYLRQGRDEDAARVQHHLADPSTGAP
ncbi:tetratricopeptide repeat protein [Saccharothrix sp. NPDC042600]|uniref:ATP-binding protein n=1 Tax=Saccharothrix TaxID=2071 RepID=UPI0033DDC7EF|nr:hypothetical protein GCM10017745_48740 [Saccharothrix mutabilis subsp. capreolus]